MRDKLVRGGHVSELNPRTKAAPWQKGDPIQVHCYADRIESTSGNVLTVEASDVSSSWGKRPDWICCDELVEWRRRELWDALWSATGKRPRSRIIVISTAGWDKSHHSWQIREIAQQESDWYFSSRSQCASWIRPEWLEQQARTLPEHVYKRLHLNLWVDGFGAFLSSEEVERIFVDILPAVGGKAALGLDVGLTRDRTVLAAVRVFPGAMLTVDALETWQGNRENKVDLEEVEEATYRASIAHRAPIHLDPHQAVQLGQSLTKRGRQVKEYTFTTASRRDLFAGLLSAIRDDRLRCRPHEALRKELLGLEVQTTASGSYRVDHKAGRFDDHVVAVSLAIMGALERDGSFHLPAFGYTTDGPRVTMFGFAPATETGPSTQSDSPVKPPTPTPMIRCDHGFDIEDTGHRTECQSARKRWKATPIRTAPTLVNPETGAHMVVNPSSGKGERYEDRRGLEYAVVTPYESCGRCGKKWPLAQSAERRHQHITERQHSDQASDSENARNAACRAWAGEQATPVPSPKLGPEPVVDQPQARYRRECKRCGNLIRPRTLEAHAGLCHTGWDEHEARRWGPTMEPDGKGGYVRCAS